MFTFAPLPPSRPLLIFTSKDPLSLDLSLSPLRSNLSPNSSLSPPPPLPHLPDTFPHLSLPPHLLSLSSPPPPSLPLLTAGTVLISGQLDGGGRFCLTPGQRCMQHLCCSVPAGVHMEKKTTKTTKLKNKPAKLSRACHLGVKEPIEMDISKRTQLRRERRARRSPQKRENKQHIISSFHR